MNASSAHARRSRTNPDTGCAGFSLVELVFVLAILSIVAAMAVPRFASSLQKSRAELATRRLVADLKYARQHARQTSDALLVRVNTTQEAYRLVGLADPDRPGSPYKIYLSQEPYMADIVSVDFGATPNEVSFDIFGKPDSGGTVVLGIGSFLHTVTVDADTGEATWSRP